MLYKINECHRVKRFDFFLLIIYEVIWYLVMWQYTANEIRPRKPADQIAKRRIERRRLLLMFLYGSRNWPNQATWTPTVKTGFIVSDSERKNSLLSLPHRLLLRSVSHRPDLSITPRRFIPPSILSFCKVSLSIWTPSPRKNRKLNQFNWIWRNL